MGVLVHTSTHGNSADKGRRHLERRCRSWATATNVDDNTPSNIAHLMIGAEK
jgi:hypothetical protein